MTHRSSIELRQEYQKQLALEQMNVAINDRTTNLRLGQSRLVVQSLPGSEIRSSEGQPKGCCIKVVSIVQFAKPSISAKTEGNNLFWNNCYQCT